MILTMTQKDTINMTVSELVFAGVQEYIQRNGWTCHDEDAVSIIAEDIFEAFGVQLNYSLITEVIDTSLDIETTVKLVA